MSCNSNLPLLFNGYTVLIMKDEAMMDTEIRVMGLQALKEQEVHDPRNVHSL